MFVSPLRGIQSIRRRYDAALGSFPSRSFYVDATLGNDANSGTYPDDAWQTIGRVNGDAFLPGDWVRFKRGETWREALTVPSSGIAGKPIALDAFGAGADPIINGSDIITGWTIDGGSYSATVTFEPSAVWYDDVALTENDGATNTVGANEWDWNANELWVNVGEDPDIGILESGRRAFCISLNISHYIAVENIVTTRSNGSGIIIDNAVRRNGLLLRNLELYLNGSSGFFSNSSNGLQVINVSSHHNGEHGIYLSGAQGGNAGALIQNCALYNNVNHGIQMNPNAVARMTDVTMDKNEIYANDTGILDLGSDGSLYTNNLIYGNSDKTISLSYSGGQEALSSINAELYHNTMISENGTYGLQVFAYCIGHVAENNIFRCVNAADTYFLKVFAGVVDGVLVADNNDYYCETFPNRWRWRATTPDSLADWRTDSGNDANGIDDDPAFVNEGADDYHLLVGSPCRGAGAIDTGVTDDYDGVARPDPPTQPDIGAYQFVP